MNHPFRSIKNHVARKKMTGSTGTVQARQRIEQEIALTVVDELLKDGYLLGVNDGEETTVHHSRNRGDIENALFTTDEDWLLVYYEDADQDDPLNVVTGTEDDKADWWVRLVYGNDGWDVISDYSTALEGVIGKGTPVEALVDSYAN
jgi:hypothetical protein